ncbi:excalibur calcium-binding domain-containing protein [Deinococcus sp. VB343]|uniref:excalibur calcium-binding domain-containing protein n=1 Tax=Deinococcus sp. VB343 TaxID=3385567 RepID=UPI0039C9DF78
MKKVLLLSAFALASSGLAVNCKKGKPCGNTCIAVTMTCRVGNSAYDTPSYSTPFLPVAPSAPTYPPLPVVTRTYTPSYENCTAARNAGVTNILETDLNYHPDLDRDKDGIACEANNDDAGAKVANWTQPVRQAESTPTLAPSNPTVAPPVETPARPAAVSTVSPVAPTISDRISPQPPITPVQAPAPAGLTVYRVVKADSRLLTLNSDYKDHQMFLAGIEAAPGREGVLNAWIRRTFPVGSMVLGEVETPGATVRSVYIWEGGKMLNAIPVAEGFGLASARAVPRYLPYLMSVQEAAKATGKGFWTK